MYHKKIIIFSLVLFFAITLMIAENFKTDKTQSTVKFKIKCMIIGNVKGKFNNFYGHFVFHRGILKSFDAQLYTGSIKTGNAKRDRDLKSSNFFNVTRYPKMTLHMIGQKKDKVLMKLTIKGVTKQVLFDYKLSKKIGKLLKNHRVGFRLSGKVRLKDFNLNLRSVVGASSIVLGKTVQIIAEIEGINSSLFAYKTLSVQYDEK